MGLPNFIQQNRITTAVLGLICLLVGFGAWNIFRSPEDEKFAAIRAKGYPLTSAELNEWYKAVPTDQNAALIYSNAFAQTKTLTSTNVPDVMRTRLWMPRRGKALPPEVKSDLEKLIATNQSALFLYHSATSGQSRYPIDLNQGTSTMLPHIAEIRKGVSLLNAEAWVHAANGEKQEAVDALLAAGRLADSLAHEPLLVSHMTRIVVWNSICVTVERLVNTTGFSDQQLAALQTMLAQAERPEGLSRALAGERACGLSVFESRYARKGLPGFMPPPSGMVERITRGVAFSGLKLTGIVQRDRDFYMSSFQTNIAVAELGFPERFVVGQQISSSAPLPAQLYIFSRIILPSLQSYFTRDAEHAARIRVTQAGLALERFRLAHNSAVPKDLSELVPKYLSVVPTDPMDGKPLCFKITEDGYVVYSIGSDAKDDGGKEFDPRSSAGTDITFMAERRDR